MKTGLFIVWSLGTVISLKSVDEHNGPDKCCGLTPISF